jgi:hypothetical protein
MSRSVWVALEDVAYLWMLKQAVESPNPTASPRAIRQGRELLTSLGQRVLADSSDAGRAGEAKESVLRVLARLGMAE